MLRHGSRYPDSGAYKEWIALYDKVRGTPGVKILSLTPSFPETLTLHWRFAKSIHAQRSKTRPSPLQGLCHFSNRGRLPSKILLANYPGNPSRAIASSSTSVSHCEPGIPNSSPPTGPSTSLQTTTHESSRRRKTSSAHILG